MLLIVIVTLVAVRVALRYTLMAENDQLLKDDAYEVVLAVEQTAAGPADALVADPESVNAAQISGETP